MRLWHHISWLQILGSALRGRNSRKNKLLDAWNQGSTIAFPDRNHACFRNDWTDSYTTSTKNAQCSNELYLYVLFRYLCFASWAHMTPAQPANACCELWEIAQSRIELRSFTSCQRALARVLHVFFVVDDFHHPMVLVWTSQDQSKCVQWSHLRSLFFFCRLYVVVSSFQFQRYCWWTISEKNPLVNDKPRCESCPSHVFWIIGAAFTRGFAAQFAPPNPKWWSPPNRSGFRMTRRPNAHVDDFGVILAHKLLNQYHNIHVYIYIYEWVNIFIYDIL